MYQYSQFITINSLYMFPALFAHHQEVLYVQQLEWNSIPTVLAASQHNTHKIYRLLYIKYLLMMSKKCSKHVEAIDRNKQKVNSASCWYCCTDMLHCVVNGTLNKCNTLSY
jgi:hypothetical protein